LFSVLFPGGSVPFSSTVGTGGYVDTGSFLLKLAKEANDKGEYFPVWGTCLGFEFMIFNEAQNADIMTSCNAWNVRNKLKFTAGIELKSSQTEVPAQVYCIQV
jgi:gamma-glutamyl hydrolase